MFIKNSKKVNLLKLQSPFLTMEIKKLFYNSSNSLPDFDNCLSYGPAVHSPTKAFYYSEKNG